MGHRNGRPFLRFIDLGLEGRLRRRFESAWASSRPGLWCAGGFELLAIALDLAPITLHALRPLADLVTELAQLIADLLAARPQENSRADGSGSGDGGSGG